MAFKKIVIAVDHSNPTSAALKNMGQALRSMYGEKVLARAKAVSVINWGEYAYDGKPQPKIKKEVLLEVKKNLAVAKKTLGLGLDIKLIEHPGRTTKSNVQELAAFLRKSKADLVVAATQNKKGLGAYFLGSFVEALTYELPCALLTVHPETKVKKKKSLHYLISSDLRKGCEKALAPVMAGIDQGDEVTIYHHFEMGLSKRSPDYAHDLLNEKNTRAHKLQESFEKLGAKAHILIETETGKTYQHILAAAEEVGAGLIVATAKTEKLSTLVIGSTARKLLKTSRLPVLLTYS